jgi:hypothetical protein
MRSQIKTKKEVKSNWHKKTHSFLANIEEGSDNAKVKEEKKRGNERSQKMTINKKCGKQQKERKKRVKAIKMLLFYKKIRKEYAFDFWRKISKAH